MKIDMTALRGLEREKEISFDLVVGAIETALLTAYKHTEGAQPDPGLLLQLGGGGVGGGAAVDHDQAGCIGELPWSARLRVDQLLVEVPRHGARRFLHGGERLPR